MSEQTPRPRPWLKATDGPLYDAYDLAIVDLDGTVYVGRDAVPGAADVLRRLEATRMRTAYVTNNAARTPAQVAQILNRHGIDASPEDVVTSAQAAAAILSGMLPVGSPVLVVGGRGLVEALEARGLTAVTSATDSPAAVAQGWTPELDWRMLAEGAYALTTGVPWVATNTDLTVPTSRGIAPGNGSFVALLGGVVGRVPDVVAGKPGVALLKETAGRYGAGRALVVGDRLDTDIAGALAAGMDSLLVLTGVSAALDVVAAARDRRPTYIGVDLGALLATQPAVAVQGTRYQVRGSVAAVSRTDGAALVEIASPDPATLDDRLDLLRAAAAAAWQVADDGGDVRLGDRLRTSVEQAHPPPVSP